MSGLLAELSLKSLRRHAPPCDSAVESDFLRSIGTVMRATRFFARSVRLGFDDVRAAVRFPIHP